MKLRIFELKKLCIFKEKKRVRFFFCSVCMLVLEGFFLVSIFLFGWSLFALVSFSEHNEHCSHNSEHNHMALHRKSFSAVFVPALF